MQGCDDDDESIELRVCLLSFLSQLLSPNSFIFSACPLVPSDGSERGNMESSGR